MRVVWAFLLIIACLLTVAAGLYYFDATDNEWAFRVSMGALVVTFILLIPLYRIAVKPMKSLSNGVNLLRGQDFSSRLAPVGQYEADRIVDMVQRHDERVERRTLACKGTESLSGSSYRRVSHGNSDSW